MRLPHFAKRPALGLAALALALAACSDSAAPDAPFSATGTSDDIAAVNETFAAPVLESFAATSDAIDAAVGGGSMSASIVAAPSQSRSPRELAMRLAKKVTANFNTASMKPSFASSIPVEYSGKTFEYDIETDQYVATDRTGAPADGVRFILYTIDPLTQKPAEPVEEVGYAQVTASESGTSTTMTLSVVGGGVTYLSYTATATITESSAKLTILGSVSNGSQTANFSFSVAGSSGGGVSISYVLTAPNGVSITIKESVPSSDSSAITLQMEVKGPHGRVSLSGSIGMESSFNVYVNGDLFATITEGETTTITGANGQELTADEQQTLQDVMSMFSQGIGFLVSLVAPPVAF